MEEILALSQWPTIKIYIEGDFIQNIPQIKNVLKMVTLKILNVTSTF